MVELGRSRQETRTARERASWRGWLAGCTKMGNNPRDGRFRMPPSGTQLRCLIKSEKMKERGGCIYVDVIVK